MTCIKKYPIIIFNGIYYYQKSNEKTLFIFDFDKFFSQEFQKTLSSEIKLKNSTPISEMKHHKMKNLQLFPLPKMMKKKLKFYKPFGYEFKDKQYIPS